MEKKCQGKNIEEERERNQKRGHRSEQTEVQAVERSTKAKKTWSVYSTVKPRSTLDT